MSLQQSQSCSWCHTLNDLRASTCRTCGHDAHRPRMQCMCPQCCPAQSCTRSDQAQLKAQADAAAEDELAQELARFHPERLMQDILGDESLISGVMLWRHHRGGWLGALLDARVPGIVMITGSTPWEPLPTVQAVLESLRRAAQTLRQQEARSCRPMT
jgi:hypothetical protein